MVGWLLCVGNTGACSSTTTVDLGFASACCRLHTAHHKDKANPVCVASRPVVNRQVENVTAVVMYIKYSGIRVEVR